MWIIVKRAAMFLEDEYATNATTGEMVQIITNQMTVYPNQDNIPQEIPAWAEDDELCQLGVQEGWLIETTQQSAQAAMAQAAKTDKHEEKVPVGMTPGSTWGKKKS